ncbi:MAG: ComEC family competence protein, partial [Acidobacteriota bacterium]|nr:ComEC family competence protein [Acidobacteriota bacterium]
MRLPAIAIAAVFVLGIVFGLAPPVAPYAASRIFLAALLGVAVASLLAGMLLVYAKQFAAAAVASLACWMLLGVAGACLDEQPRCADYILNLAAADKVHLKTPLRYLGRLRDEPAKLAWGLNYEIELSGVEIDGSEIPVSGGLRLSYVPRATRRGAPIVAQNANGQADEHVERSSAAVAPPEVHVGDIVAVLTQPRLPSVYRDEGAFDRRAFLVRQNIDVIATLRAPELLEVVQRGHSSINARVSRVRRRLRDKIDALLESQTSVAGVLRAMLLGDKSFVDRDESTDFQKTGTFHVLVVAGLHVAAFALLISWIGRLLRLPQLATAAFTLMMMFGYVCVVEQRAPVLRAALMAAIVVVGRIFFRRLDLLNTVAVAATILLAARPSMISDSSFQFSFLAIACIAGLGSPWLQRTVQ